jgi:hypothetical protein
MASHCYGYPMIVALMRNAGRIQATSHRLQRIWGGKGSRRPRGSPSAAGSDPPTAPAFGCGPNGAITSGPVTSSP